MFLSFWMWSDFSFIHSLFSKLFSSFLGFTVQISSEWVESLHISLTICTQSFWFVHPVKCSVENVFKDCSPYHWGTEINSLTISKNFKTFFLFRSQKVVLSKLLLLLMCFGYLYLVICFTNVGQTEFSITLVGTMAPGSYEVFWTSVSLLFKSIVQFTNRV